MLRPHASWPFSYWFSFAAYIVKQKPYPYFSEPVTTFAGNPVEKGALVRVNDRRRGTVTKIEGDLRLGAYECPGFLVQLLEVYHEVFCSSSFSGQELKTLQIPEIRTRSTMRLQHRNCKRSLHFEMHLEAARR